MNTPLKIDVLKGQLTSTIANESKTRLKCGRPVNAKDTVPQKRRLQEINKKNGTQKESMKQKKVIEIGIPEEYITTKACNKINK